MSGITQETFPEVRKALSDVWECSEGPPGTLGCPGVVGRPSQMSGSGRETLPDVREWSGGPLECPGVVRSSSRMAGSGQEALLDVRELSRVSPG